MAATILMLLFAMALIALSGGCARDPGPLDGTRWRLTSWTLSSLDPRDFDVSAAFADGKISGYTGVNSYGGSYALGPGQTFKVGQLASTEMGGPAPAMRAEGAYLTLLMQARAYRLVAGRLTLLDAGGNESLVFEQSGPSGVMSSKRGAKEAVHP